MPPATRIRLRVEERVPLTPCRYTDHADPGAGVRVVPYLRLTTSACIVNRSGGRNWVDAAVLDTGAWVTAIEASAWQKYDEAGLIEHLPIVEPDGMSPSFVGGATSAYRLGRLWIQLLDPQPTKIAFLSAVPVVAQLLLNPGCRLPSPILLGLHLGVLDGRRLTREPVLPAPAPLASDRGSWFGQQWYLETV